MELHNTVEDIVIRQVEDIFNTIEKEGNKDKICTCSQCRMDTACYALNRIPPFYIVSHRGISRVQQVTVEQQQKQTDITVLIYEGIHRVSHNQRTDISHTNFDKAAKSDSGNPVFNIPTVVGRLFNGMNFAPISGIKVELIKDNALAEMKGISWQNPFDLVHHTDGTFTFWPAPIIAAAADEHMIFEYTIRVSAPEYETLNHVFKIPVKSEFQAANSFMLGRTFKLPDLYLFPPGEREKDISLIEE